MTPKPTISTVEELMGLKPAPCATSLEWLADNGITDLADAWDRCHRSDWMLWLGNALDLLSDRERRMIACKCVRETPLIDGRKVWDLLDDESRRAVAVAERYTDGDASDEELAAAYAAASAAVATVERAAAAAAAARAAASAAADAAAAAAEASADAAYAAMSAAAAAAYAARAAAAYTDAARAAAADAASAAQADLIREIAGNPFREG